MISSKTGKTCIRTLAFTLSIHDRRFSVRKAKNPKKYPKTGADRSSVTIVALVFPNPKNRGNARLTYLARARLRTKNLGKDNDAKIDIS